MSRMCGIVDNLVPIIKALSKAAEEKSKTYTSDSFANAYYIGQCHAFERVLNEITRLQDLVKLLEEGMIDVG